MITFTTNTNDCGVTHSDQDLYLGCSHPEQRNSPEKALGLEPDTRYLTIMVPMPDGYRLVTEEDRKERKPVSALVMESSGKFGKSYPDGRWDSVVYLVPGKQQIKVIVAGKEKMIDHDKAVELGLL